MRLSVALVSFKSLYCIVDAARHWSSLYCIGFVL